MPRASARSRCASLRRRPSARPRASRRDTEQVRPLHHAAVAQAGHREHAADEPAALVLGANQDAAGLRRDREHRSRHDVVVVLPHTSRCRRTDGVEIVDRLENRAGASDPSLPWRMAQVDDDGAACEYPRPVTTTLEGRDETPARLPHRRARFGRIVRRRPARRRNPRSSTSARSASRESSYLLRRQQPGPGRRLGELAGCDTERAILWQRRQLINLGALPGYPVECRRRHQRARADRGQRR